MKYLRPCLLAAASALCIPPCGGIAQSAGAGDPAEVASSVIPGWLDSGDPRLVAWGAYFSVLNGDASGDATMVEILDRWAEAGSRREELSDPQLDAFAEILDALIQHSRTVSPETLGALAEKFPAQAAIFASRLPLDEAMPLLQAWYAERKGGKEPALARIAAMMLSKSPPPGFAASVLAETGEVVRLFVLDPGVASGGSGTGGSYYSSAIPNRPGWPPIYRYAIVGNPQDGNGSLLVEAGGDRITYHRTLDGGGFFVGVGILNDETRHHLLLQMLGGDRSALQWQAQQQISLGWEGPASFLSAVGSLVDEEESKLSDTVEALYEDGLLSPDEAAKVRPALFVNVVDDRGVKDSPIPKFESRDPRTMVAQVFSLD